MRVFGKNVVKEILNGKKKVSLIYLSDNFNDRGILDKINDRNILIKRLSKRDMDKLSDGKHQGIIAEVEDYKYYDENKMFSNLSDNPFIVILDHIEDPHNFGAIIRTCEAALVSYVIIPKDRCVKVNATVEKTSAGAIENVKIVMVTNLNNTIRKLKEHGVWVVGTAMEGSVNYTEIDYSMPVALVLGNEGAGMSTLVKKNCDFLASIPMRGKVNSLNASVAAGIMIYEVVRRRS